MKIKNNVCYCNKNAISNNFSAKIIAIKIIIAIISRILNKFFFLDLKEKSEDYSIFEKQFSRIFVVYSNLKCLLYILHQFICLQSLFLMKFTKRKSIFTKKNYYNKKLTYYCKCNNQ